MVPGRWLSDGEREDYVIVELCNCGNMQLWKCGIAEFGVRSQGPVVKSE